MDLDHLSPRDIRSYDRISSISSSLDEDCRLYLDTGFDGSRIYTTELRDPGVSADDWFGDGLPGDGDGIGNGAGDPSYGDI
jgi:hypothetical protein